MWHWQDYKTRINKLRDVLGVGKVDVVVLLSTVVDEQTVIDCLSSCLSPAQSQSQLPLPSVVYCHCQGLTQTTSPSSPSRMRPSAAPALLSPFYLPASSSLTL